MSILLHPHQVLIRRHDRLVRPRSKEHFTLAALPYLLIRAPPPLHSLAFRLPFTSSNRAGICFLLVFSFCGTISEAIYLSSGEPCMCFCTRNTWGAQMRPPRPGLAGSFTLSGLKSALINTDVIFLLPCSSDTRRYPQDSSKDLKTDRI